jgi:hypothetical protein
VSVDEGAQPLARPATTDAPAGHCAHDDPPKLYEEPTQATQPAALEVPALVTMPAKPAAHTVHAATEPLPAVGVETLAAQVDAQRVELAGANVPTAQLAQRTDAAEDENDPAAQTEQDDDPKALIDPAGHAAHDSGTPTYDHDPSRGERVTVAGPPK